MSRVKLTNVRLSFPSLFKKASFNGEEGTKYEATFLLPKSDVKTHKAVMDVIEECKVANKNTKVASDKLFIKDGDDIEYEGYAGHWAIKTSNNSRPTTINRDRSVVVESDEVFYAGCYVNAIIEPWSQSNQYGKRINANLLGVQFVKDGEAFGNGPVDVSDEFDDIEEDYDL